MFFGVNDESIRYTGRWNLVQTAATTTAPGGMIEIAYSGKDIVLHFDLTMNMHPYPRLWIILDDLLKVESTVDHIIRVEAMQEGDHVVKIIYKSAVECQHRWFSPLIGKIVFSGYEAEGNTKLPEDNRKIIEFIGDSITEGVLIDAMYNYETCDQLNRPIQDDSTATYAYLTAIALNMKPVIIGYGAVGTTKGGQGSVPKASVSYPYNYHGSPAKSSFADLIVINHGANDRCVSPEEYVDGYRELLKEVRKMNPDTPIVILSAFCNAHTKHLRQFVEEYNKEVGENLKFIDSTGWIPEETLHPLRDGHKIVAGHLIEELKNLGVI